MNKPQSKMTEPQTSKRIENEKPAAEIARVRQKWNIEDSKSLYNIEGWGADYFSVNKDGNLCVLPDSQGGPEIEILDVIQEISKNQQVELPCIIRFQDLLRKRVERINEAFKNSIREADYKGLYRGVYPIKVNQMREVIEEILDAGQAYHFGLEAGSKAELQIVLAYNKDPEALTICNGFKDQEYIRLALLGRKLGRKIVLVVEKLSEIEQILKIADEMEIEPLLGIRAKLATPGAGKWQESGGSNSKFGLSAADILNAVEKLRKRDRLSSLKLLHFHIGSQIPDIRTMKSAVQEGARLYSSLRKLGAPLDYFDVGGGLGVDYDGSQSKSDFSINYTTEEYVSNIVHQLQQVCDEEQVEHPHIVSESGRSIVAYHACLIMKVIDTIEPTFGTPGKALSVFEENETVKQSEYVQEALGIMKGLTPKTALESYHDSLTKLEDAQDRFKLGALSLRERALVEQIHGKICLWICNNMKRMKRIPDEFYELKEKIVHQYVVNFSVFQSAPDHWAFDQLFPICPIHRMNEKPKNNGILVDITCDSDGEIDRFISRDDDYSRSLKLHSVREGRPYYLGVFLTGAYQDIMGDMHNLFGRVNEVHVFKDDEDHEDYYIEEVIRGDTISGTLRATQYSLSELNRMLKQDVDRKVKEGVLKPKQGVQLVDFYSKVMNGYTYLRN